MNPTCNYHPLHLISSSPLDDIISTNQPLPPRLINSLQLRRPQPRHTPLLIRPQPRFLTIPQHAPRQKVHHQPNNNQHKRNRIQIVNRISKNLNPNHNPPKVPRQQRYIEEGSTRHTQDNRRTTVEQEQDERVASEVATNGIGPVGRGEYLVFEDTGYGAVDQDSEEAEHAQDFVRGTLAHEPLLIHIRQTVESCTYETKEVAFELCGWITAVGASDVVRSEEDAHASTAEQDSRNLNPLVAHLEEGEGYDDNHDDGPEVEELSRENIGVLVGQNSEVIAQDIQKTQNNVFPAIDKEDLAIFLETISVDRVAGVDGAENDVVEEGLECWERESIIAKQSREGVGASNAKGQDLSMRC